MSRDLRILAGAVALSAAGDLLLVVVLSLRVHDLTGDGYAVAALFAALMGPIVALAPLAGRLVDRLETRNVLLTVSIAQAAVASGLVFADGLAPILVLAALLGAGAAVAGPAEASLVPATVDAHQLTKANGWVETARYTGFTAGPILAGLLTAAGGTKLGLAANAASFLAVAIGAAAMQSRRIPQRTGTRTKQRGGLKLLTEDATLRIALGAAVAALLFISASMTVEVFYVRDVVGSSGTGFALVFAGWTAGMALGAVGLSTRIKAPLAAAALLALAVQGGGMAAAASWAVLPWVIGGYVVGGVGHGVKNVLLRTLIQQRVPAEAHGRAFAAYGAARNSAELGALGLGGVMISLFGAQPALLIAGLGPVVAGLVGLSLLGAARSRRAQPAMTIG
jgi:Na+/melibiose symporter-like transporter